MPTLLLIKHSKPLIDPRLPSSAWRLSQEGRALCSGLADRIAPYDPAVIVASTEPKATQTGQLVAERLGKTFETAPDLHEHDRANVPHMPTREFLAAIAMFFQKPHDLVLGRENAEQARERLQHAVDTVLARHPDQNIAIITHGTILSLFVAHHAQINPFQFYREMQLPSFVALALPDFALKETVHQIH